MLLEAVAIAIALCCVDARWKWKSPRKDTWVQSVSEYWMRYSEFLQEGIRLRKAAHEAPAAAPKTAEEKVIRELQLQNDLSLVGALHFRCYLWLFPAQKSATPLKPQPPPAAAVTTERLKREVLQSFDPRVLLPATLFSLVLQSASFLEPWISGRLFDAVMAAAKPDSPGLSAVWELLGWSLLLGFCIWFGNIGTAFLFSTARWQLTLQKRDAIFRNLLAQDLSYHDLVPSSELNRRLHGEPERLQDFVNRSLEKCINSGLKCVGGALFCFVGFDWRVALLGMGTYSSAFWAFKHMGMEKVHSLNAVQDVHMRAANEKATEALDNIRTVQTFVGEETEATTYSGHIRRYLEAIKFTMLVETALRFTRYAWDKIFDLLLVSTGLALVVRGDYSLGAYLTFRSYLGQYGAGLWELGQLRQQFEGFKASAVNYFDLLDRKPLIPVTGGVVPASCTGRIEFRGVRFRYASRPDHEVLRGIDLVVPAGQTVAIVGESGAGKSTVVKLLQRFYEVDAGAILLDGTDIRELSVKWLRGRCGFVAQEPLLFDQTVLYNIVYGCQFASEEERIQRAEDAARIANAHEFIMQLDRGYNTIVGQGGVLLSGGQKQRIAIARAIVRDPVLILLDEATSSLDSKTEHSVQQALDGIRRGRTTFIVAHRLSTVMHSDCICVLEGGRIVEQGTHQELMARSGKYAQFVAHQLVGSA